MKTSTLHGITQVPPETELVIGPILFFINRRFGHLPELFGARMHRVNYPNGKSIRFYKLVKNQSYRQATRIMANTFERLWEKGYFEPTGETLRLRGTLKPSTKSEAMHSEDLLPVLESDSAALSASRARDTHSLRVLLNRTKRELLGAA